jgi:type IV pilus assembly protein PilO
MAQIKLTKQQQQLIAATVLSVGAFGYIYFTFFWMPLAKKITETTAKIDAVEKKIEKAQQLAARLPRLEAELVRLNDQAVEAEKRLPKKKAAPEILVTVGNLAVKHHVTLVSFNPGAISNKAFFSELSYPMSVKGSFHSIGKFFAAVSLEERIFNLQNVVYTGGEGELTVTFTLVSYQYKG